MVDRANQILCRVRENRDLWRYERIVWTVVRMDDCGNVVCEDRDGMDTKSFPPGDLVGTNPEMARRLGEFLANNDS